MDEREKLCLKIIGDIWRNDWSGYSYNGKDLQKWLNLLIDGDYKTLMERLTPIIEEQGLLIPSHEHGDKLTVHGDR